MRGVAGPLDLLGHEAPASRPLERELGLAAGELSQPRTQLGARRRRDPAAPQLTRLLVERLVGDLVSMHIQRHYDPHRDLLELRRSTRHRVTTTLEPRGSHYMSSLYEEGPCVKCVCCSCIAQSGRSLRLLVGSWAHLSIASSIGRTRPMGVRSGGASP